MQPSRVVLLSGPVAAGRTTLATALGRRAGFHGLKTRDLINRLLSPSRDRRAFQAAGEALDRRTKGGWVARGVLELLAELPADVSLVVDSVHRLDQVHALRQAFGPAVTHIHLTAPEDVLRTRYNRLRRRVTELSSYAAVRADRTEAQIDSLADAADLVIDTSRASAADIEVRAASHLGLYADPSVPLVDVIIGGGYGSEGKGQIAAYLAPEYQVLLRTGGPNAGHTVYDEPKPYTFHHLPSGTTRNPKAKIILGPGAVIWIDTLLKEIADNEVSVDRLSIDPRAMIIEQSDRAWEDRALRGTIASTAQGVGRATARKVLRDGARPKVRLARDARLLKPFVRETLPQLDSAFAQGFSVMVEGTQGTALSLHHGFYPFVTSRDTTVSGCLAEAGIPPSRVRRTMLVCRTFPIRVQNPRGGTSGPLTNEISWAEVARRSGIPVRELRGREKTSTTKRRRRVGEFDWSLLRRSASLNGPSDVALTFVDYLDSANRAARRFEQLSQSTIEFIEEVERVSAARVSLIATRFAFRSIIDRREW